MLDVSRKYVISKKRKEKKNMEILTKNLNQFISLCQSLLELFVQSINS